LQLISEHIGMIFSNTVIRQDTVIVELISGLGLDEELILIVFVIDWEIWLEIELDVIGFQMMSRADV
jgi:hypothetical protein